MKTGKIEKRDQERVIWKREPGRGRRSIGSREERKESGKEVDRGRSL